MQKNKNSCAANFGCTYIDVLHGKPHAESIYRFIGIAMGYYTLKVISVNDDEYGDFWIPSLDDLSKKVKRTI
jgi:hypothetical protein